MTPDGACVDCGMRFRLAWTSERSALLRPTRRNLAYAVAAGLLIAASQAAGQDVLAVVFLAVALFFFARTFLGSFELFVKHRFVAGKLGPLVRRGRFNPLVPKPYATTVGAVRFPIDRETYGMFGPEDTLLVEHLRWSRLILAVYRGHR